MVGRDWLRSPTHRRRPRVSRAAGGAIAATALLVGSPGARAEDCPGDHRYPVTVELVVPAGNNPSTVTIELSYPKERVAIPGTRNEERVAARVTQFPKDRVHAINDQDGTLRVVLAGTSVLDSGPVFDVEFDTCKAAPVPGAADFRCAVVGCAGKYGKVNDCTCEVHDSSRH